MSIYEATKLTAEYRLADRQLRDTFDHARDRHSVRMMDRQLVSGNTGNRLLAVNTRSRIAVAKSICGELAELLCVNTHWEHDQPVFFFTIIPKAGYVGVHQRKFDPACIANYLRVVLRGLDYLAVIEPAYFASLPAQDRTIGTQIISWHVHALIWNIGINAASSLVERLGKSPALGAIVKEYHPVHARQVNNGELPTVVRYLMKPPSEAKRVQRYPRIKNGEIVLYADGSTNYCIKQRSAELQKSERLRLFQAMKHLTLDQLIVGGGEGKLVRANALDACDRKATRRIAR